MSRSAQHDDCHSERAKRERKLPVIDRKHKKNKKQINMKKSIFTIILTLFCVVLTAQTRIIYVSPTGTGGGTSWADAANLTSAIDLAQAHLTSTSQGAELWLKQGIYDQQIQTVQVPNLTKLFGGFVGTETALTQRNFATNPTVIDAQKRFGPVVHLGQNAELNGLTIQNGFSATFDGMNGGAVYMETNAEVRHCHILNSIALNYGGGIFAVGNGRIVSTLIKGNKAGQDGFAVWGTTASLINNTIVENQKIIPSPQDTIDIFFPDPFPDSAFLNPSICYGESITIGWTLATQNTYLWSSGEITPTFTTPALTTNTSFSVIVATANRENVFLFTFNVHVKPLPTLTLSVDKNPANIGDEVKITATGTPTGGMHRWRNNGATLSETGSVLTRIVPTTGNLFIECTYSVDGCEASASTTIVNTTCVYPIAPSTITATYDGYDGVYCSGGTLATLITVSDDGTFNSGTWKLYDNGTLVKTSQNPIPIFEVKPTATTTYYLVLEGCESQIDSMPVTVTVTPNPTITTTFDAAKLCIGDIITLEASIDGGTWSIVAGFGAIDIDEQTGELYPSMSLTGGRVEYRLDNGCFVHTPLITVNPNPVFANPNENDLCQRSVMAHPMPLGETYVWTTNPTGFATVDNNGNVTGNNVGTTVLRCRVERTGCFVEKNINVIQQPALITGTLQVCEGATTQLGNTVTGGTWSSANEAIATVDEFGLVTATIPTLEGQPARTVAITYTLNSGCLETVMVTVNPAPRTMSLGNICLDNQERPVSVIAGFAGGTWSINQLSNFAILTPDPSISTNATVKGNATGTFTLTYTTANGCSFTSPSITVNDLPTITGENEVSIGSTTQLSSDGTTNEWWSANNAIAEVSNTGIVTGRGAGTVTISYRSNTGCLGTYLITVLSCPAIAVTPPAFSTVTFCHRANVDLQIIQTGFFSRANKTALTWTKNSVAVPMPTGLVYDSTAFVLSGNPTESGTFYWTVTTVDQADGCDPATWAGGSITIYDSVQGGIINFFDSLPTVGKNICAGLTFGLLDSDIPGSGGCPMAGISSYQWIRSADNGTTWQNVLNASETETYSAVVHHAPGQVLYKRLYKCATCLPEGAPSNIIVGTVNPLPDAIVADSTANTNCLGTPNGAISITYPIAGMEFRINGYDYQSNPVFSNVSGSHSIGVRNTTTGCFRDTTVSVPSTTAGTPTIGAFAQIRLCDTETTFTITPSIGTTISPTFEWVRMDGTTETALGTGAPTFSGTVDAAGALTVTGATAGTWRYRLTVTNNNGCWAHGEQEVYIRPKLPTTLSLNYDSLHICVMPTTATSLELTTHIGDRPRTYQWQMFNLNPLATNWTDIAGADQPTFTGPTNVASAGYYRVRIQDVDGLCPAVFSDSATVIVEALPATPTATDSTRCGSGTLNLAAFTTTPGAQIFWFSSNSATTQLTGSPTNSGQVWTTNQSITAPASGQTGTSVTYYVEARTAKGCVSSARTPVNARAYAPHTITLANAATTRTQSLCQGTASLRIDHSFGGGANGLNSTVAWTPTTPPISGTVGDFQTTGLATAGTYQWIVTTTGHAFCPAVSDTGTITILSAPAPVTITSPNNNSTHCNTVTLTAAGGTGGTIWWQTTATGTDTTLANPLTITTAGTHNRWARARSDDNCWTAAVSITATVNIVTITQPNADALSIRWGGCESFANLTATATGATAWQWYYVDISAGGTTQADGILIEGATTSSLTPTWSVVGTRRYFAAITIPSCETLISNLSGTRTVTELPTITDWTTINCNPVPTGNNQGIGLTGAGTGLADIKAALGQVSYGTVANTDPAVGAIQISGNGINQEWSAHVLAAGCDKTNYGPGAGPYRAACRRSNSTIRQSTAANGQLYGDYFSWCAVVMLADLLCPPGWRVPTCRDFVELDIALGGTGSTLSAPSRRDRYIANSANDGQQWFGTGYSGNLNAAGTILNTTSTSYYWSQTERSSTIGYCLAYTSAGSISPQSTALNKNTGAALRCVR